MNFIIFKKFLLLLENINMLNISLDELRLIPQNRNIRDYVNKSEKDLIKAPTSEIEEAGKNLTELKKRLRFKKFEYGKIGSSRRLFKGFDRDYYKSIRTDGGFAGRNNNYIEYKSRGIDMRIYHPKNILI